MQYDTLEEAQSRLKNTTIYYDGQPVYVREIHDNRPGDRYTREDPGRFTLHFYTLGKGRKTGQDLLSSPLFKQNGFRLGYFNLPIRDDGATRTGYITRMTTRRTKQGICAENLHLVPTERDAGGIRYNDIHMSEEIKNMLIGSYPSLDEAVTSVQNGSLSSAFHRHFAVSLDDFRDDIVLMYRGTKIGYGDGDRFKLGNQYVFCKEAALEAGIRNIA